MPTKLISCTSHFDGDLHRISFMSCSISDVEFLLEVISDLVRKTCCPPRYLLSPAFLKNLVYGEAEVFCGTEWRQFVFQLGWKIFWRYLLKLLGPSLNYFITKVLRNILKGVLLWGDVLFKLAHCNVLLDAPWFKAAEQTAISFLVSRFFGWP